MEIEQKFETYAKEVKDYMAENDKRLKAIEEKGFESAETKEMFEKFDNALDEMKESIDKEVAALKRNNGYADKEGKTLTPEQVEHKEAFSSYLRKGHGEAEVQKAQEKAFEKKLLSVVVAEDGGLLVPDEMSNEIVKRVFDTSIIRDLASTQTISSSSFDIFEDLDEVESGWVAEREERTETDTPKVKLLKITAEEIFAQPKATQKFLEDASVNVESWLAEKAGEKISRDENYAFIRGNGLGKPRGILDYADGNGVFGTIETKNSGVNGDFAANPNAGDIFLDMVGELKQVYRQNAYWGMHRKTVSRVRKFKDNDGAYIWQPSFQAGQPDLLAGYPIREFDDMDAPADYGTGSYAVVFGDFRAGYQIVDRRGITLIRDAITQKGKVLFYFTKRVGGAVKNYDAIKRLKLSA